MATENPDCVEDKLVAYTCQCGQVLCRRNYVCLPSMVCAPRCNNQYYDYDVTEEVCACATWDGYSSPDVKKQLVHSGGVCTARGQVIEACTENAELKGVVCKCGSTKGCTGDRTYCKQIKIQEYSDIRCVRYYRDIAYIVLIVAFVVLALLLISACIYQAMIDRFEREHGPRIKKPKKLAKNLYKRSKKMAQSYKFTQY